MRIAHITATFPPYSGGTGNVCFHNARELAHRGHDVHVFTVAVPNTPNQENHEGVTIHRLRSLMQIGNAPLLPQLLFTLRNFDILHIHYPFILGAEFVKLASSLYHSPLIISLHNDLIGYGLRKSIFSIYQYFSARFTVNHAAALCVVTCDHFQHSKLRRLICRDTLPIIEIPNGVDTIKFHPRGQTIRTHYGIPKEAILFLFVAALDKAHHYKGLGRLLQASQALPEEVWLMIVGDGDLRAAYQKQAALMNINSRIIFAGNIPQPHLPPIYRSADVTILPSSAESFGLVIIESLACGTPVIASNIPGVRSVVTSNKDGFLVDAESVEDLTHQLKKMINLSVKQRQRMGQLGREKVEQLYEWQQIGLKLENVYQASLSKRSISREIAEL